MGDVGRGHYDVQCHIGPIDIPDPSVPVSMSFAITNGATPNEVELRTLLGQGAKGAAAFVLTKGVAAVPVVGLFLAIPAGWFGSDISQKLADLLSANCDGVVAGNAITLDIPALATTGVWLQDQNYPGTDSPHGCGANSNYNVQLLVYKTDFQPPPPPTVRLSVAVSPYPMPINQSAQVTVTARDPFTLNPVAADVFVSITDPLTGNNLLRKSPLNQFLSDLVFQNFANCQRNNHAPRLTEEAAYLRQRV